MKCYTCNKQLNRPPSQCQNKKLFCNHKCYSEYKRQKWSGKNNPRYKEGIKDYKCLECNKTFSRKSCGNNINSKNKFCSIKCSATYRGKLQRGENHWNYKGKGGRITRPIRTIAKYEKWRLEVFKRDDFKCVECKTDKELHIHHIEELSKMITKYIKQFGKLNVYADVFYQIDNGKTLCKKCHKNIHKLRNGN